jgi:hypothetical protein
MAKADDDDTAQPSGRQKPLAEWIAELGAGPVSWGRAADELIAGRYRSWWFNHVTGEWNQIVQQYWLSPDPSDHRMAGLSLHERAWLRMNDATLGWEGRYAVYVEATPPSPGAAQMEGTASVVFGGAETTASVSAMMADAAGEPGEVQPPKNLGGRPRVHDWFELAAFMIRYVIENDLPKTQAELVTVMERWFETNEKKIAPESDLQKFASLIFKKSMRRRPT